MYVIFKNEIVCYGSDGGEDLQINKIIYDMIIKNNFNGFNLNLYNLQFVCLVIMVFFYLVIMDINVINY